MLFLRQEGKQIPRFARNDNCATTERKDTFACTRELVAADSCGAARKCSRLRLGTQGRRRKCGAAATEIVKAFIFSGVKTGLRLQFGMVRAFE